MKNLLKIVALVVLMIGALQLASAKKVVLEPSTAWTISEPLGLHFTSTIDTLQYCYFKSAIPWLVSNAYTTTGNYGSPGQNQIFFERGAESPFFFERSVSAWIPSLAKQRYYNTRTPMTLVSYTFGGTKYTGQDRLTAEFSGNVNKQIQIGAAMDYLYSKGSYDNQNLRNFTWRVFGSYIGDRLESQFFFNNYDYLTKENGGITDDRYITNPAEVQGGSTQVDTKTIPTNLSNAYSQLWGHEFYMNHRYKVGYYKERIDSVADSVRISKEYVPVTSFIWTMDYKINRHMFLNKDATQDTTFFENTYLNFGGTEDKNRYWKLTNTFGIDLLEGSHNWAKFGLSAYVTHEVRRLTQTTDSALFVEPRDPNLTPLPEGFTCEQRHLWNVMWAGGQLTKRQGKVLTYNADFRMGVLGSVAGDMRVSGKVTTNIKIKSTTLKLSANGYFRNEIAPYALKHYISNHYVWNNKFDRVRRFRVGGSVDVPFTGTNLNVGYETLQNYVYFGNDAVPVQSAKAIHVFSATLNQALKLGIFNWNNTATYQKSSDQTVLALPAFSLYSNMYIDFAIARVLKVHLGVDCNYYTRYYAPKYNPATMVFYNQQERKCGNFAMMNVYANFKLKKTRFFVMLSHFNQGLFGGKDYFATPGYPLNPRRLQFGVSVDFAN